MLNKQVFLGRTRALAFAVVFATALILAACGSSDSDTGSKQLSGSSDSDTGSKQLSGSSDSDTGSKQLSGDIIIDGSSTVFPITEAVAEEFGILTGGKTRITVGISGTGGGFKKFCAGETHIQDASRPVKQSEIDLCADSGRESVELPVAIDGLSVIVHPTNDFVDCLTIDELHTLWSPEAEGKITRWNQVRDSFPDESVNLYGPGVNSGTFDYFTETVNGESQASRGDFLASEDDNVLVHSVSNDANGLGYFGYAYYTVNADKLKIVPIDGGDGCIEPTDETINNGTYAPLSRPLFLYVEKDALEQEQVLEFIRYYLGNEARGLISEVGYIPYPDNVYQLAKNKVESRMVGAVFGGDNRLTGTVEEILAASSGE